MTSVTDARRFFDSRAAYMMFVTTTNEKAAIAGRVGRELASVRPGEWAVRVFDAGMGDATVLAAVMRELHEVFPHVPWLVVGKEISVEDVRHALDRLPDRLVEHPELVFVVTNLSYRDAPRLASDRHDVAFRVTALEGTTAHDFAKQIRASHHAIDGDWAVRTSEVTGNPVPITPAVHVFHRADRAFVLKQVIPDPSGTEGLFDLIIASQPYRARSSADQKARTVVVPLAEALAPGGLFVGVHGHGHDPGMEIIHAVWPDEDPFETDRHDLLAAVASTLGDRAVEFDLDPLTDEESLFEYGMYEMPSETAEHIGTSAILAAWNAAVYVAQIDEDRLTDAVQSGAYIEATRRALRTHGRIWFRDESYVIRRR